MPNAVGASAWSSGLRSVPRPHTLVLYLQTSTDSGCGRWSSLAAPPPRAFVLSSRCLLVVGRSRTPPLPAHLSGATTDAYAPSGKGPARRERETITASGIEVEGKDLVMFVVPQLAAMRPAAT